MKRARVGTLEFLGAASLIAFIVIAGGLTGCGKAKTAGAGGGSVTAAGVSNKLAAIEAAGEPVTPEQLDKWYVEPPAGENAADIYEQAFAVLPEGDATSPSYVAQNQKAVALLLQAAEREECRYPIDLKNGFNTPLPHLTKVKRSAQLLATAAGEAAGNGNMEQAAKLIQADIRLARSLENEPLLISRLVAVASLAITTASLQQSLTRHSFDDEQLMELQQSLRDAESLAQFRRVFVGERATMISAFQMTAEQMRELSSGDTNLAALNLTAYRDSAGYQEDFNFALDRMDELLKRADKKFPEALEGEAKEPDDKLILSKALVPTIEKVLTRAAQCAANLRLAQTALAIERYRIANANALPADLNDLKPRFLTTVPEDPFDGKPLRYKKLAKGYMVYSVGRDQRDDGGKAHVSNGKAGRPEDITFTVTR